jgi:hypothetical protein
MASPSLSQMLWLLSALGKVGTTVGGPFGNATPVKKFTNSLKKLLSQPIPLRSTLLMGLSRAYK